MKYPPRNLSLLAALVAGFAIGLPSAKATGLFAGGVPLINGHNPNVQITVNANSTVTVAFDASEGPYDGIEDSYVKVVNNSGSRLNSLTLTGANIFGFDGDGQAAYTGTSYDSSGYAGPNTSFNIVNANSGTVVFAGGLNGGATAWFTLEENLTGSSGNLSVTGTNRAPDTGSTWLLLGGAIVCLGAIRRRFSK
ncbi:MAG: hypothetical protein WCQ89_02370 [Verrucomicrobiota bacterium]